MSHSIASIVLISTIFLLSVNGQHDGEKYRLQVHYSVKSGWSNDPNGVIYAHGYYHLFYQHHPYDTVFGSIHWAHARSKDLIHWEDMPIALKPYDNCMIYSGCCFIDEDDVAGFASNSNETANPSSTPMLAFYTMHEIGGEETETQGISYSFDYGTTWTNYKNNPIIPNPGIKDFRDPMVFQRHGTYYMTLVLNDRVRFMSSIDLTTWDVVSEFGVDPDVGDKSGVWECPSMVTLKDEQGNEHDILLVSLNNGNISYTQYFVGKFNGTHFNDYNQSPHLWFDNGFDNYASIPYLNDPLGRTIVIGWMSNWAYAQQIPTSTWRGQFTIPREMTLKTVDGKIHIAQKPVDELHKIVDSSKFWTLSQPMKMSGYQTLDLNTQIPFALGSAYTLEFEYDIGTATNGNYTIRFSNRLNEEILFNFDFNDNSFEFDRRNSGNVSFNPKFGNTARFDRISNSKRFTGKMILDTTSVEMFVDGGLNSFTALFFPTEPFNQIQLITTLNANESIDILKFSVSNLNSILS